jgi:cephalosporin-C deacetylase-like acetyl esterase
MKLQNGLSATLLLGLFAVSTWAQDSHTVEQRARMFDDYLVKRAAQITRSNLADLKDLSEWKLRRPVIRKQMLYMLGLDPTPERTRLHARITRQFERDTYRVENVVFESMPGLYVTGNLYIPKRPAGRLPTVLYLSGHEPGPWGAKVTVQHHGIWFARHGYVCFITDTIEFGEIPGIHHGTHDLGMWYWLSLGYTPAGPEVWNAIRALDYLETRPEVDPHRIALTGISGGGTMSWFTAAVDDRPQVVAAACSTWTVEHHVALNAVVENCDCIYFINTFMGDLTTAAALIAPRPLKIISARQDPSFPSAGYHEVYRRARPIYDLYGAADRLMEFDYDAPHADILPFRKQADEWINHWLKNDLTPFEEGEIKREEPVTLTVLDHQPANAINGRIHKTFIPVYHLQPWNDLASWKKRRTKLIAEMKDRVFRAFPQTTLPFDAWKAKDEGWISRYAEACNVEFSTEEGIRVTGELFVPRSRKPPYPALIYFKGAEDVVYPIDYDPLLPVLGSHVVLVLNPRAVDYPADNYKMATLKRTAALIGATIESMQVWDLRRCIDYLVDGEHLKLSSVSVYGRRGMGALALYAAAFDERISRVILDDPPASHWQGPALVNILRLTDLPEAAGLIAPREIVSLTPLPAAYAYTSSIYALYGKKNRIRQAGDLGEALAVRER